MTVAEATLLYTPLHALHLARGGRMTAFAGYEMPLQYAPGILAEHLHTRAAAGLFDVSHMGQIELRPRSGDVLDAALALEGLVPADIAALGVGRQKYGLLTNTEGGILDDLMIANLGDRLLLVVNAACKAADLAHLEAHLSRTCSVEALEDRALVALQGPAAEAALARLAPAVADMRFLDVREVELLGAACTVSRSAYTGEDGFEIGLAADRALDLARALLEAPGVLPVGLGARDSLRLEAGLCLYGSDLSSSTTPVEAALEWTIQKTRRPGGARAGGYPGAAIIGGQLASGAARRRVGLRPQGRAPVRAGARLFASEQAPEPIGSVTSGCFGPSLNAPVAMGYVDVGHSRVGDGLFAEVRGARLPVVVAPTPFVPNTYRR
ncbi:MAG TPA: glycine cleavage system aminomethyltransferase GcvT [Caulobacteraceae bacterium]|jgi:aminomethyltransferase|nr:glycine cleavage system aminomethyltransferase GcvT [Caulobacteraceae bacterium]